MRRVCSSYHPYSRDELSSKLRMQMVIRLIYFAIENEMH
jgi:hypothetical protein